MTISRQSAVVYHGYRPAGGAAAALMAIETGGAPVGVVRHVSKHSPTGMSWGYAGSGPADCARSLLLAALGADAARCARCTGTVVDDPTIDQIPSHPARHDLELVMGCTCDDGFRRLPCQQFQTGVVARFGGWLAHAEATSAGS